MPVSIDGFLIDMAEVEGHDFDSDVTEDEVEDGGAFTDNIKDLADVINLQGVVTDTPIGDFVRIREQATASGIDEELPFLPSDEAQSKLLAIRAAKKPVIVQTSRGTFESMALTKLNLPVTGETGDALSFSVSFRKIRVVTNDRVTIKVASPNLGGKSKRAGVPVVVVGRKAPNIRTASGRSAEWNPDKGRYEYPTFAPGTESGRGPGVPVPDSDLAGVSTADTRPAAIEQGNATFFDQESDEWKNSDGSPVTRAQQKAAVPADVAERADDQPWYTGIGQIVSNVAGIGT